jgi:phenylpropionate dioxygenase-like ring-hydroxylating dioxygenase large terminal subunit
MEWLRNCWYAAAWGDEVAPGDRIARTIIEIPLLIWRDGEGRVHALANRCPHRLAPLEKGRIDENVVRCGYHGLAFDGATGVCVDNPHGPVTSALAVRAYPVVERHGILWVWTGEPGRADQDAVPGLGFIDTTLPNAFSKGYMRAAADHRLLEDNIFDLSHGDYLHPETLGGGAFTRTRPSIEERVGTVFVQWLAESEQAIPIWRPELPDPDQPIDMLTEVEWHPSGVMLLRGGITLAGEQSDWRLDTCNAHIMTPETPTSTHYFYCNSRNYRTEDADYNALLALGLKGAFEGEDKPMIEGQQANIGNLDLMDCGPALLAIDNASTRARRMYRRLVAAEHEAAAVRCPDDARHPAAGQSAGLFNR